MTIAATGDPPPSVLLAPLLEYLPGLFQQEVLRRLGPTDLASLAGARRGCAAAVAATALMQWAKRAKMTPPEHLGSILPPLCLKEACSYAARCGNREVSEWLHNAGCPWDITTCRMAAMGGHLEVLRLAREHGCPWGTLTSAFAAGSGHLHVLQWAREHHCLWNWLTPAFAAEGGHIAVLQWAMEHDCRWDSNTCACAARAGRLEVLQWVRENDATGEVWRENLVRTLRRRSQEAGGAELAGSTQCSVKSIRCVHAQCAQGTATVPHEATKRHTMTHSICTIFLRTRMYTLKIFPRAGRLARESESALELDER
jgi:hypothetical protein